MMEFVVPMAPCFCPQLAMLHLRQVKPHHRFLLYRTHCSLHPSKEDESGVAVAISDLVLSHAGDASSLTHRLASTTFRPSLVDRILKLLWDDAPRALLFFDSLISLPSYDPAPSSFDHAIDLAARLRHSRTLRHLLRLHPRPSHRTFSILFERHASHRNPDLALRLFLSMHRHGCQQDLTSFNSLLDALAKSHHIEKAASLLKALRPRFGADVVSYNIIADGWCRVKRTSQAMEVLKEMVASGVEPTMNTYNILLKGFFRAGQVKQAWDFFMQMKKRARSEQGSNCQPDLVSYTTVVHGLGLNGQLDKARRVFDEMIKEGCLPSVATYNALIQVICKKGSVQDAILVFEEMVRKGHTPNLVTYNLVIRGSCHHGQMDRALEFMERLEKDQCKANVQTYNILLRYWCEEGEIEKGLELFEKMGKKGVCLPNLDTYNVLISAMFARKRPEDMAVACKMVVEMVDRGYLPRRFMFNRVLNGLLLTGNQDLAKDLLRLQEKYRRLHKEIKL